MYRWEEIARIRDQIDTQIIPSMNKTEFARDARSRGSIGRTKRLDVSIGHLMKASNSMTTIIKHLADEEERGTHHGSNKRRTK